MPPTPFFYYYIKQGAADLSSLRESRRAAGWTEEKNEERRDTRGERREKREERRHPKRVEANPFLHHTALGTERRGKKEEIRCKREEIMRRVKERDKKAEASEKTS